MAVQHITTVRKIRFPTEMLEGIEAWAAERHLTRSKAVRVLLYRRLACDWSDWKCDCDGADQYTGNCDAGE